MTKIHKQNTKGKPKIRLTHKYKKRSKKKQATVSFGKDFDKAEMKVCYFGTYEKNYPLNSIIIKGLKKNSVEVEECHVFLWEKYANKYSNFLKPFSLLKLTANAMISYLKLVFKFFKKCRNIDVFVVGYIGQIDVLLLKTLTLLKKNKPKIIFIPLVSLYNTAVIDRNLFAKNSASARFLFYIDKLSFKIPDLIILDTNEHIAYICRLFGLDERKFKRVWVGADNGVFYPIEHKKKSQSELEKHGKFNVLFFGKYIPLHGVEYIIKAAKLLEYDQNIKFRMIGNGQLYNKMFKMSRQLNLKNVDFTKWIEHDMLVEEINRSTVVLGIFGGAGKSLRVIPNKIFQAVACRKPVITGASRAIKELFTDEKNILLCENKDPLSLKSAVLKLKNNNNLRKRIADNGYKVFSSSLTPEKIGKRIKNFIYSLRCNLKE